VKENVQERLVTVETGKFPDCADCPGVFVFGRRSSACDDGRIGGEFSEMVCEKPAMTKA
jgi:hypothetical protein